MTNEDQVGSRTWLRISRGDQVEEIPLEPAREVPVGSTPGPVVAADIAAGLVIHINTGRLPLPMRCAECDVVYSGKDLERQILRHIDELPDGSLTAAHDCLEPWIARIRAGETICFGCAS